MPGPVALIGAGEFLPMMAEFDASLLAAIGRQRPRVAILPTAAWADGKVAFQRTAAMGVAHFGALGAEVEPVPVRVRSDADDAAAAQALEEADLIYLSGGKPGYLIRTIEGTAAGRAIAAAHGRGAFVAGSAAGAVVLASRAYERRIGLLPWPLRWRSGLGVVPGASVLPAYDSHPEPICALMVLQAARGAVVLGIDEGTAAVGHNGVWQVHGRSRVTVWRGRRRDRYRAGEIFRLDSGGPDGLDQPAPLIRA